MLTSCFLGKEQKYQKCFVFRKGKRGGGGGGGGGGGRRGGDMRRRSSLLSACEEGDRHGVAKNAERSDCGWRFFESNLVLNTFSKIHDFCITKLWNCLWSFCISFVGASFF